MVRLFGIPAATNTATSRLAGSTGAAILPYFVERLPGGRGYRAVIQPAPRRTFRAARPSPMPSASTTSSSSTYARCPSSTAGSTGASKA